MCIYLTDAVCIPECAHIIRVISNGDLSLTSWKKDAVSNIFSYKLWFSDGYSLGAYF